MKRESNENSTYYTRHSDWFVGRCCDRNWNIQPTSSRMESFPVTPMMTELRIFIARELADENEAGFDQLPDYDREGWFRRADRILKIIGDFGLSEREPSKGLEIPQDVLDAAVAALNLAIGIATAKEQSLVDGLIEAAARLDDAISAALEEKVIDVAAALAEARRE